MSVLYVCASIFLTTAHPIDFTPGGVLLRTQGSVWSCLDERSPRKQQAATPWPSYRPVPNRHVLNGHCTSCSRGYLPLPGDYTCALLANYESISDHRAGDWNTHAGLYDRKHNARRWPEGLYGHKGSVVSKHKAVEALLFIPYTSSCYCAAHYKPAIKITERPVKKQRIAHTLACV